MSRYEKLDSKWIDEHAKAVTYDGIPDQSEIVYVDDLENLIVPKQELPVIPEFVADWIEEERGTMSNWKLPSRFISDSKYKKDQRRYKWSQFEGNMDKFMSALINGYEVEVEQKFYVLTSSEKILLTKEGGVVRETYQVYSWINERDKEHYQLTEQEIRDYDPRYMAFVIPVEEPV